MGSSTGLEAGGAGLGLLAVLAAPFTAGTSLALLPAALSVGGAAAGGAGAILGGEATSSADQFKAQQLDQAAQYGELKATQTNAQMTRNLSITLGNIDAVRAAARNDPTSPTGAAVRDYAEQTGTENKNIKVDSIFAQSQQDEASAAYLRSASGAALLAGDIGAGAAGLKGAGGLGGLGGGTPGSINSGNIGGTGGNLGPLY